MLRHVCVGLVLLAAGQAWASQCHLAKYGTLPVEMVDRQPTTVVKINGQDTRFIVDTGAFYNTMSSASASLLGLRSQPLPFGFRMEGVGGTATLQLTHVKELGILDSSLKNVDFLVGGTDVGNGLLGANLLDMADLEIDLARGKMTLFKPDHCGDTVMAYWVKPGESYEEAAIESSSNPYNRSTFLTVKVNGEKLRAVLDTGAGATVLSRRGAERAGIDLHGADVAEAGTSYGVGGRKVRAWTAKVAAFTVGSETIQGSRMQVLDDNLGGNVDMLLGVDFILAHHLYIANSSGKMYFTYNGGRVFTYAAAPAAPSAAAASGGSAEDHLLAGQALQARGELKAAKAELDQAVQMAPDHADYYLARAGVESADRQNGAALTDLDTALRLQPSQLQARLMRAQLRLAQKDDTGAATDVASAASDPAAVSQARLIATLYIRLGQPGASLPLLDRWVGSHPHDALLGDALKLRCQARALVNQQLDDALHDCREAIHRDGPSAADLNSLGLVQLRLGHYPEAIEAYRQSLALDPALAWSRYGLGLAELRSGQSQAGQADMAGALKLDPSIGGSAAKYGLTAP